MHLLISLPSSHSRVAKVMNSPCNYTFLKVAILKKKVISLRVNQLGRYKVVVLLLTRNTN